MKPYTIALAGNPNCGKTTVFNALTGSKQRIGNWPGVTVEKVEGDFTVEDTPVHVIDLPGIYSFSAHTIDETIARKYILMEKPDLVVNIVDASNLERNLYLTTQLIEMRAPVIVALNMMDRATQRNMRVEVEHLQKHLDCPVIPLTASRREGLEALTRAIGEALRRRSVSATHVYYDSEVEESIGTLKPRAEEAAAPHRVDPRWLSIKLLEGDELARRLATPELVRAADDETARIERHTGAEIDLVMADGRYGFIHGLARDVVRRALETRKNISDAIDQITLNRFLGIPIFLAVMYLVFALTIQLSKPLINLLDHWFGRILVDGGHRLLDGTFLPPWMVALLADGVGGGMQVVATLAPPIFFIFVCLALLEDSGYMARAAFVMDRFMRKIGLPGKAFLPMLIGFGCNVPAILATRTLENERDRIMTVLLNPFMSCGARLPVYILFTTAFFPRYGAWVVFGLYLAGVLFAALTGFLLKGTVLRGEATAFVMELPPYHVPTVGGILHHAWSRLKDFILRAGQIIIIIIVILNLLHAVKLPDGRNGEVSALTWIGKRATPALSPMGIDRDNWPATVGLVTGIFAKEAVIGTLDALYTQTAEPALTGDTASEANETVPVSSTAFSALRRNFKDRASALAYLFFILLYTPCLSAIAAMFREIRLRWTLFSVAYQTLLAWLVSVCVYQLLTIARHPVSSAAWIAACLTAFGLVYAALKLRR